MIWIALLACNQPEEQTATVTDPDPDNVLTWSFGGQIGEGGDTDGCARVFDQTDVNVQTPEQVAAMVQAWTGEITASDGSKGTLIINDLSEPEPFRYVGEQVIDCTTERAPGYQLSFTMYIGLDATDDRVAVEMQRRGTAIVHDGFPPSIWAGEPGVDWPDPPTSDYLRVLWGVYLYGDPAVDSGQMGWFLGNGDLGVVYATEDQLTFVVD